MDNSIDYEGFAKTFELTHRSPYYHLVVNYKEASFIPNSGQGQPITVPYNSNFKNEFSHRLTTLRFEDIRPKQQNTQIRPETMIEALKSGGPIHSFA